VASGAVAALKRVRSDERLLVICGSTVLVMAGQGMVGPVLPLFARDFGVSAAVVGLTFTAFGLARLLLNIPAGIWADRRGRRFLLVGGPLITSIGMLGSGLSPSIWVLLGWRLVAGAGSALYMTGAQIYLVDIAGADRRARYLATNQGALLVGVSAGPAIGGLMAAAFGLRAPFLFVGVAALGTATYAWFRLPETGPTDGGAKAADGPPVTADDQRKAKAERRALAAQFFRSRQFVAVGLVSMSVFAIRSSRQSLIPLHASETFGIDTGRIGLLFAAIGVVGLVLIGPAGWLADNAGRKPMIVVTGFLAAAGTVATALAPTAGLLVLAVMFGATATSAIGPAPGAFVADLAPDELRGSAMGAYRTWGDAGIVLAPPVAGLLADTVSIPWAFAATAAFVFMTTTWFLLAASEP
jgi:MFS family permease